MSGSTTPVSSANSYSDAEVRSQSVWQAEANQFKVAQLDDLLRAEGVQPGGNKRPNSVFSAKKHLWEGLLYFVHIPYYILLLSFRIPLFLF